MFTQGTWFVLLRKMATDVTSILKLETRANVHVKHASVVTDKLQTFITGSMKNLQVISDFDQTMTKKRGDGCTSSYGILNACPALPKQYLHDTNALFEHYYPLEMNENLEREEKLKMMLEWWFKGTNLLQGIKLPYSELEQTTFKFKDSLRDKLPELLAKLHAAKVPMLVFSAGIGDVIEIMLRHRNLMYDNLKIISNFLDYDEKDTLRGCKGDLIHVLNKGEQSLRGTEFYDMCHNRDNVLVLGDSIGDSHMADNVTHAKCVLKIGFLNEHIDQRLENFKDAFDIVIVDDSSVQVPLDIINAISD